MSDQFSFDGDYQDLWNRVSEKLSTVLNKAKHTTFVKPLTLECRGLDAIALKGSSFVIDGLERCGIASQIRDLFNEYAAREVAIEFVAVPVERAVPTMRAPALDERVDVEASRETFDNFVVGRSNEMAFNAARRVALEPGIRYNPLFIYGASGLGKTHLLRAIQNDVRRIHPMLVVRYMTAQEFSEEYIYSLQHGRIQAFRSKTRSVNVWLLDDIQFIARREKTQEELYHAFNHLHQEGRQIVIAADSPPRELYRMDERMRSRFEGGLLADIMPPETDTRIRILEANALREGVQCPPEVLEWIAMQSPPNVRSLIGAFNRCIAAASISNRTLDIDLARTMLRDYFDQPLESSRIFGDQILDECAKYFGISRGDLTGSSRVKHVVRARHLAMFLLREGAGESLAGIGLRFGRHHSSVLHACEKVRAQLKADRDLSNDLKCIRRELGLD